TGFFGRTILIVSDDSAASSARTSEKRTSAAPAAKPRASATRNLLFMSELREEVSRRTPPRHEGRSLDNNRNPAQKIEALSMRKGRWALRQTTPAIIELKRIDGKDRAAAF